MVSPTRPEFQVSRSTMASGSRSSSSSAKSTSSSRSRSRSRSHRGDRSRRDDRSGRSRRGRSESSSSRRRRRSPTARVSGRCQSSRRRASSTRRRAAAEAVVRADTSSNAAAPETATEAVASSSAVKSNVAPPAEAARARSPGGDEVPAKIARVNGHSEGESKQSRPAPRDEAIGEPPSKKAKVKKTKGGDTQDRDAGVIRRAAVWRAKYNPRRETTMLVPTLLGFHGFNREGIPCNGDRCDTLLGDFTYDGFEREEADRDNYAIRVRGPSDPGITYNIDVCADHPKLATCPKGWVPVALTLSHSHVNQILKNCLLGAKSDVDGIVDSNGRISMQLLEQKDADLAQQARSGLHWEVFPPEMAEEEPEACYDISAAANIKNGRALLETEMQGFLRLGRVCQAESSLNHEVDFLLVKQKMAITMPKMANSPQFVDLFALSLMLASRSAETDARVSGSKSKGIFLSRLGDFFGQWVNPAVRQVRYSDFATLGQFPAEVGGMATAPLLCAIIEAMYAADIDKYTKDEYLEWLKPNDVKIDLKDDKSTSRVVQASHDNPTHSLPSPGRPHQ